MITLNFSNEVAEGPSGRSRYYYVSTRLHRMKFRFSTISNDLPYLITANPSLHEDGLLAVSLDHPFGNRAINMIRLKEILENSPVALSIKMFSDTYLVGKGFIAKMLRGVNVNTGFSIDHKVELLFAITANRKKIVSSPHNLKIYLNRELYEPQYKRIMAILKPYMSEHKGDIFVTKSINQYLLYQFSLPTFKSLQARSDFNENMKEFFFRSLSWNKWMKDEKMRLQAEKEERERVFDRIKREKDIQDNILSVLTNEELRLAPVVVVPELVEEVPSVGEQLDHMTLQQIDEIVTYTQNLEASMREEMGLSSVRNGEIPMMRDSQPILQQQQPLEPLLSQLTTFNSPQEPLSLGLDIQAPQESLITVDTQEYQDQVDIEEELIPIQEMGEMEEDEQSLSISPVNQNNPNIEHISEDEMLRIMGEFAIRPPVNIQYSTILDPASGIPIDRIASGSQAEPIQEEPTPEQIAAFSSMIFGNDQSSEVNEDTEVVLEDEDEFDETEDELDNDPDAYEDAVIVESHSSERAVFSAMEGGTDGG